MGKMPRQWGWVRFLWVLALLLVLILTYARVLAAVTVSSFSANVQGAQIGLKWSTATETNNVGFNLLRSNSANGNYTKINPNLIPSQCLGCITGANYSYTDSNVTLGQAYYYKLQSVANNGATELFGPASAGASAASTATSTATATVAASPTSTVPATATSAPTAQATATPLPTTQTTATKTTAATPTPVTILPPAQVAATRTQPTKFALAVSDVTPNSSGSLDAKMPVPAITPASSAGEGLDQGAFDQISTDETQSTNEATTLDGSYFAVRLIKTTVGLFSGALVLGSALLVVAALYSFLRAYLR